MAYCCGSSIARTRKETLPIIAHSNSKIEPSLSVGTYQIQTNGFKEEKPSFSFLTGYINFLWPVVACFCPSSRGHYDYYLETGFGEWPVCGTYGVRIKKWDGLLLDGTAFTMQPIISFCTGASSDLSDRYVPQIY